jgi:hypothetical protein
MAVVVATVDCNRCGTPYTGSWVVPDAEQLDEAPRAVQECPECFHQQDEPYPGWTIHTEAG